MSRGPDRSTMTPSRAHETRRALLETIADAAGFRLTMPLPDGRRPDVLRVHVDRAGLFLGEAKHTEGPCDLHSADRLRDYLRWLVPPCERAVGSVLAVAHPRGLGRPWRHRVDWLCQGLGIERVVGSTAVTPTTTVTFVVFGSSGWRHGLPDTARTGRSGHNGA